MVTKRQKIEIKHRMRAIKKARDEGRDEQIIEQRTQELMDYLHQEGIVMP